MLGRMAHFVANRCHTPYPMRGDAMRRFWLMLILLIVIVVFFGFVLTDSLPKLLVRNLGRE